MKKIITTVVGSALIALSVANAAGAAERQQTRRSVQQPSAQQTIGGIVDPRDSYAEFGAPRGTGYGYGGYDGRVYGGAISAPAGR